MRIQQRNLVWLVYLLCLYLASGCEQAAANRSGEGSDSDTTSDSDSNSNNGGSPIPETCEAAAQILTSVGCEFFTADLNNHDDTDSNIYAVVVSNPQETIDAAVRVEDMRGTDSTLRTIPGMEITLAPGELHIFELTCDLECPETTPHIEMSGFTALSAFRLVSDVPVLAYQWNPYGFETHTTDASLLFPTTSLAEEYIGTSWNFGPPDYELLTYRAEITVIATQNNTSVTFKPTSTTASGIGMPTITAGEESIPLNMNAFDVAQIAPAVGNDKLTGTLISATKPVAVFGGHSCALIPTPTYYSCDHVEEQLMPLIAWGSETVLARYAPRFEATANDDPAVWRIVAGADDMTITFDPPVLSIGTSYHFDNQGQMLQFISPNDHYATATLDNPPDPSEPEAPFFAFQMMTGRMYVHRDNLWDEYEWGDPMMLLSPPAGQYLDRYVFNTDSKFDFTFDRIIVVREAGAEVEVDCLGVLDANAFSSVGSSGWEVGRFDLDDPDGVGSCVDGAHWLTANKPVGLSVVGEDYADSYGYLAGVGIRAINPVAVE